MQYTKREAKEWARDQMRGACNVIMPTFTTDLRSLNEQAIRHDVRRSIELGFWGSLVVSEGGTTHEEYKRFLEIVVDEAKGRLKAVVHGLFDTFDDTVEMAQYGEAIGAAALLLAYPPTFYPKSDEEVYGFTNGVMERTKLATILFAVHQWNFARVHPAQLSPSVVARLAESPNAVAIKAEGAHLGNGELIEILHRCADKIILSDPREYNAPAWVKLFGMQWMGTSNYECYGDAVPRFFKLMHEGRWDEAMAIYWQIHPIRAARSADMQTTAGANIIHRFSWKYQAWLNGFNGGPLRFPTMRLNDGAAARLRQAMISAGTIASDTPTDLEPFFHGRNPA